MPNLDPEVDYDQIYSNLCQHCRKQIPRWKNPFGKFESLKKWLRRKFCDDVCEIPQLIIVASQGGFSRPEAGKAAKKILGRGRCVKCNDETDRVQPVDGNWSDLRRENLHHVCQECGRRKGGLGQPVCVYSNCRRAPVRNELCAQHQSKKP